MRAAALAALLACGAGLFGPALAQRQAEQTALQLQIGVPPLTRTGCPRTHPVKGHLGQGVRVYTDTGHPRYAHVQPMRCFRSAVDAIRAGYRASR